MDRKGNTERYKEHQRFACCKQFVFWVVLVFLFFALFMIFRDFFYTVFNEFR